MNHPIKLQKKIDIPWRLLLIIVLIVSVFFRIEGILNDFWLDEIWSLLFAESLKSPLEIITKIHHDNNHYLNTLFLYYFQNNVTWYIFRIPSLVAGFGIMAMAVLINPNRGGIYTFTTLTLIGFSFIIINYSTEARGYSMMLFFALAGFWCLRHFLSHKKPITLIFFWSTIIAGSLSHLTFIHFFTAAFLWSSLVLLRKGQIKEGMIQLGMLHVLPVIFIITLYFINISGMVIGGGPDYSLIRVVGETINIALGASFTGIPAIITILVAVFIFVAELIYLYQKKSSLWIFYLVVIFLSPAVLIIITQPKVLLIRYFLISILFFLILLSHFLCRCYMKGHWGKYLYIIFVLLFCLGNGVKILDFMKYGRGSYIDALKFMDENSGGHITISSDHDFRNKMTLFYYLRYLPEETNITYYSSKEVPDVAPMWYITHSQVKDYRPSNSLYSPDGTKYTLEKEYRYACLSGWHWFIYKKEDCPKNKILQIN